ncbi:hypothetical protein ABZ235_19805 [Streptomyces canus]|uniref:hypothetical protein n=1 Tax=Streptomyces canus TaxID=58343 RepID=UPI0033AA8E43
MVWTLLDTFTIRKSSDPSWTQSIIRPRVDQRRVRETNRRIMALCRFHGHALTITSPTLHTRHNAALVSQKLVGRAETALVAATALVPLAFLVAESFNKLPSALTWSPKSVAQGGLIAGLLIAWMLYALKSMQVSKLWKQKIGDREAILSVIKILELLSPRTSIRPFAIEQASVALCSELSGFAKSSSNFATPERRKQVEDHVAAVCEEIMQQSGKILSRGSLQSTEPVSIFATLLDRLLQDRWLQLLDVENNGLPIADTELTSRRDAWIMICGSLAAALGLGGAATLGIPLAAAAPAAIVFLLGPATLWGSRRLGISPRSLLASARSSVEGGTQTSAPGTGPASQNASASPQ